MEENRDDFGFLDSFLGSEVSDSKRKRRPIEEDAVNEGSANGNIDDLERDILDPMSKESTEDSSSKRTEDDLPSLPEETIRDDIYDEGLSREDSYRAKGRPALNEESALSEQDSDSGDSFTDDEGSLGGGSPGGDSMDEEEDLYEGLPLSVREALEWEPPEPKSTEDLLVNEWIQTGWVGNLHVDQILTEAILTGASDVHITAGLLVSMTRNGDIIRYDGYPIPDEDIMHEVVHDGILGHVEQDSFNNNLEYEGAYTLQYGPMAGRRTRLTIGITFGNYFMVFRIINESIPDLASLGVEDEMVEWSNYPNGLFLLCGPTGSGKSTTLASIVHDLQKRSKKKIITIEKPIEYIYPDDTPSLMVQRDVGEDTLGFYEGLTSAMRQSPNVILLGEVRNTEEVTELLRAAETGHLAISTMHTNSVPTTINRIQNLFDGNEQRRIMSTLADTLRGIGNQVLVKTKDGEGRFAVRELLTVDNNIKDLIINGDIRGIKKYQIENRATMEHKLAEAVKEGKCHREDALAQTTDPVLFEEIMSE